MRDTTSTASASSPAGSSEPTDRTMGSPEPGEPGFEEWVERSFESGGVDRSLIEAQLERSPGERLALLERTVNELLELRGGRWPELP